jgi:acetyltransferase-like isoleucine patch superfamily enzyme
MIIGDCSIVYGRTSLQMNSSYWRRAQVFSRRCRSAFRFFGQPIHIDPTSWVSPRSDVRSCGGGRIVIGKNCEIHPYSMILTYGGDIYIGDNCSLNPFAIVYGHGGVRIGDGVRIAAHTVIIPANHNASANGKSLLESGFTAQGIEIEDNVWLGSGVTILDGVRIGRNSIIGAGSVVTRSIPDGVTVAGVPARAISRR